MICFNFWNFNNNVFSIVNKIDPKVIWTMGLTLFVFSLLPYLTTFVAENFYVFFPQFMYGLIFIITAILSMIIGRFLKDADPVHVFHNRLGPNWNGDWISRISSSYNDMLPDINFWSLDYAKN